MTREFKPWYAVYVKPRHEKQIAAMFRGKGYEPFLPMYKSGGARASELPLFPCYVFCRFNPDDRLPILIVPGVFFIVGVGKTPAPIAEDEMSALRAVVASGYPLRPYPSMKTGDKVQISAGPLRGVEGHIERTLHNAQLIVSISLLQRSVAVSIDSECVVPAKDRVSRGGYAFGY